MVWQLGTGYFGARTADGTFYERTFEEKAHDPMVKMIELKLSQGAKPAHGGILPEAKISDEISRIRGIPKDQDCLSPHTMRLAPHRDDALHSKASPPFRRKTSGL